MLCFQVGRARKRQFSTGSLGRCDAELQRDLQLGDPDTCDDKFASASPRCEFVVLPSHGQMCAVKASDSHKV